jgi:tetratricopeptide (TPR) repeat protein
MNEKQRFADRRGFGSFPEHGIRRVLTAACYCSLLVGMPAAGWAQKVGDRVLITTDFETKIKDKAVGKVFSGQIRTVTAVEPPWCAVSGVEGWLPAKYAISLAQGIKYCGDRIRANSNDAAAYSIRGLVYLELGKYNESLGDFSQALKINPQASVPWNNRASVYMALGQWSAALHDLNQAIGLDPTFVDALVNRSLVFAQAGRAAEGLADIERAIQVQPENARLFVRRGSLHFDLGNMEAAWADYDRAAQIDPRNPDVHLGRGNILLSQGKIPEALEEAQRAVERQPDGATAHNLLGWLQHESGDSEAAILSLSRAINLDPTLAIAYSNRGVARVELGQLDQALADFDRAIELDPNAPLTICNRGTAWMNKGEYEKARGDFEQSLKLGPELAEVLNVFAWFLATCPDDRFRDGPRAVELATKAVAASDPPQWFRLDTLAAAEAEAGSFDRAQELQRQALEIAPDDRKEACRIRLELYQSQQPARSERGKQPQPATG